MNEVLPNAFKVGFTGTPLLRKDKSNTYLKFGKQIGHSYRFEDGIRDGVIVPLVYDGRVIPQKVTSDKIDDYLKSILAPLTEPQKEDMRRKWSSFMHLAQTEQRLSMIAFDIHEHFLNYCKPRGFKAMVAVSTRALAVQLEHAINGLGGVKAAAMILYLQRVTKELSPKTIKLSSVISSRMKSSHVLAQNTMITRNT